MSILDDLPDIVADAMGDVLFRDATYSVDAPGAGPAYDPGEPTVASYPCLALFDAWGSYAIAQGLVGATDRKVLILAATLATVPQGNGRVTLDGVTLTIYSGGEGQPGVSTDPATAVWVVRCRT